MKIAVFGAGAIGGYIAFKLWQAGEDVSVVARGDHLAAIRSNGLTLKSDGLPHRRHFHQRLGAALGL